MCRDKGRESMSFDKLLSAWPLLLGLIVIAIAVAVVLRMRSKADVNHLLQRKSRLFSKAESDFYDTLVKDLNEEFYIVPRVPLLEVIEPNHKATESEAKFVRKKYARQMLDYVICKREDLSVFGVIELENFDKNPDADRRKKRESFVDSVCKATRLRLFYFDIRQDYTEVDLYRLVTGRSRKTKPSSEGGAAFSQLSINEEDRELTRLKTCPKCHSEVVTKVAIKGSNIGEKFLMCRKYPYCDYQVTVEQAKKSKASEGVKRKEHSAGFKNWS